MWILDVLISFFISNKGRNLVSNKTLNQEEKPIKINAKIDLSWVYLQKGDGTENYRRELRR